jgi:DNA-directed RNA polymerase specialized sigma24 family protein
MILQDEYDAERDTDVERIAKATATRIMRHYRDQVDDVVSQVMTLWREWKGRVKAHKPWARTVTKNLSLKILEEETRQEAIAVQCVQQERSATNDGLINAITRDCQDTLLTLIGITEQARESLDDETDRKIYHRYFQERLNYKEIAYDLAMEEDAVRQRGCRLIGKIRKEVHARIEEDRSLKQMLQHLLDDPKWLGEVVALILQEMAQKGKEAFENVIRGTTLISL